METTLRDDAGLVLRIAALSATPCRHLLRRVPAWRLCVCVMLCSFSALAQDEPHRIATDKTPPALTPQPAGESLNVGESLSLKVEASDASGIEIVRVWYRDDIIGEFRPIVMQRNEHGLYEAHVEIDRTQGDSHKVEYYFDATDRAKNVATLGAPLLPFSATVKIATKSTSMTPPAYWKWILSAVTIAGLACVTEKVICRDPDPPPSGRTFDASIANAPVPVP